MNGRATSNTITCLVLLACASVISPLPTKSAPDACPVVKPGLALKRTPTSVEIFQYDDTAVHGRQPLLFVHGLNSEFKYLFGWQKLCRYLTRDPNFQHRYKIYLARYSTHASLDEEQQKFKTAIRNLSDTNRGQGIVVVCLSIAGNLVQQSMNDPDVDRAISRVIAMGTPFHGSPLFDSDWMQRSMWKRHKSPFSKIDRYVAYIIYFGHHKNLLRDYGWDNSDGQMPTIGACRVHSPSGQAGLPLQAVRTRQIAQQAFNDKLVAYSGYLREHSALFTFLVAPGSFFWTTVPAHAKNNHAVLRLLHDELSNVMLACSGQRGYLNDGITPVSSSLYLPPQVMANISVRRPEDLEKLRSRLNVHKARCFENVDHLTFVEGYRPFGSSTNIVDGLSPHEQPRSMFAWLRDDLMSDN